MGRPGAPAHVVGLERISHDIEMNTGAKTYGIRYCVARDEKRPGVAIPAEGYIGMPKPSNQNWYSGGFFDVLINGESVGTTPAETVVGRSVDDRAYVDLVFDAPAAVVRVRFLTLAGDDALFCQLLLEPKTEVSSLVVALRCYPSAYISHAGRHILTPVRDLKSGEHGQLDPASEWWTLYYDAVYDAGYAGPARTGVGPCAALWQPGQVTAADVVVGNYGNDTRLTLNPDVRDARFVFFDFAGTKNADAMQELRERAPALRAQAATLSFTDPSLLDWPLADKQAEADRLVENAGDDGEAARYREWGDTLTKQLALVRAGGQGAILAEAIAVTIIEEWEKSLPELKLKALLKRI
jgi:hypothetical protein